MNPHNKMNKSALEIAYEEFKKSFQQNDVPKLAKIYRSPIKNNRKIIEKHYDARSKLEAAKKAYRKRKKAEYDKARRGNEFSKHCNFISKRKYLGIPLSQPKRVIKRKAIEQK